MTMPEPPGLVIRPMQPEDQPTVRRLVLDGLADHFGEIDETRNPDIDDLLGHYGPMGGYSVVAERDGELVGAGTFHAEGEGTVRLVRMSVRSDQRGRGLGRALVAHLLDEARRRGYREAVCETCDDWVDAIALYRRSGFTEIGRRDGDIHFRLSLGQEEGGR